LSEHGWKTKRRARKDHKCDECRGAIVAGSDYYVEDQVSYGDWYRAKLCVPCDTLWRHLLDAHGRQISDPPQYGMLRETLEDLECRCVP
jgi:hypothetical protein